MRIALPSLAAALAISLLSAAAFGEEVDNPAYTAWAKCKPGSSITFKLAAEAATMKQEGTITQKLVEVKPEGVVLDMKIVATAGGQEQVTTTKITVPAKVEKGKEYLPFNTPPERVTITDMKEGKETIEFKGNKVETTVYEYTMTSAASGRGGMPIAMKVKAWALPEVPGGMIKNEMTGNAGAMGDTKTAMQVVDYTLAK